MAREVPTEYGDERPTIAFRANSVRQKARWEKAVQESDEYGSVSHLLRRAVERELAGANDPRDSVQTVSTGASEERLDSLDESVSRIEAKLTKINQSVERVENRAFNEGGISDELLTDVFGELEVGEGNAVSQGDTVEELAESSGYQENTVRLALDQLRADVDSVERVEVAGEYIYFRKR